MEPKCPKMPKAIPKDDQRKLKATPRRQKAPKVGLKEAESIPDTQGGPKGKICTKNFQSTAPADVMLVNIAYALLARIAVWKIASS